MADLVSGIAPESNLLIALLDPVHFKSPLKSYELTTAPVVPLGDGGSYLDVSSLVIEVAFLVLLVFAVFLTRRKNVRASRILIVLAVAYPIIVGSLIALQLSN